MIDHPLTRKAATTDREADAERQVHLSDAAEVRKAGDQLASANRRDLHLSRGLDHAAVPVEADLPVLPAPEPKSLATRADFLPHHFRGQGQQVRIDGDKKSRQGEHVLRRLVARHFSAADPVVGGLSVKIETLLLAERREPPAKGAAGLDLELPGPVSGPAEIDANFGTADDAGPRIEICRPWRTGTENQRHQKPGDTGSEARTRPPLRKGIRAVVCAALCIGYFCFVETHAPAAQGPPQPRPDVRFFHESVGGGWITIDLQIPTAFPPPRPVVLSPIVDERLLLERGIAVARFQTHWEALLPMRAVCDEDKNKTTEAGKNEEPVGQWLLRAPRPGLVGQGWFGFITQDAEHSLRQVIDALHENPFVDRTRISISGSSTSGFVALQAMANEPRLCCAVVQVACGEYQLFLRSSRLAFDDDPRWVRDGAPLPLDPAYAKELARIEPWRSAERLAPRPLLLMTGALDEAIPPACVHRTAEVFKDAYAEAGAASRFDWVEFPDAGHALPEDRIDLALDFWDHWLLDDRPVRPALKRWNRSP